jgi:hypothetical protein
MTTCSRVLHELLPREEKGVVCMAFIRLGLHGSILVMEVLITKPFHARSITIVS